MDDTHDKLVEAYLEYFKASEWWERNKSVRSYAKVQQATKKIQKIAKERNTEIRQEYQEGNPKLRKVSKKK